MKKILLPFFIFPGLLAFGQSSFTLTDVQFADAPIASGTSFDFYLSPGDAHAYEMNINNTSPGAHVYRVHKVCVSMTSSSSAYFCLVPGLCYSTSSSTLTSGNHVGSGGSIQIQHHFAAGTLGDCMVRYTVFDSANASDSLFIIMNYHISGVGIVESSANLFSVSDATPNPAVTSTAFSYNFKNHKTENRAVIYNSLGAEVAEFHLGDSGQLQIDVSSFETGLYFCSFYSGKEITGTKKILVQH